MNPDRRTLLTAGAAASTIVLLGRTSAAQTKSGPPKFDPIPALPKTPTPGKSGDFDFLAGEWRISQQRLKAPGEWDAFEGEATVHTILDGVGSVEDLRIPARSFGGLGLRTLDVEKKVWYDIWVHAKSGVVVGPGVPGSFENGAGIFVSEEEENGTKVLYAGVWDRITKTSCRWRQASSKDGGKTWDQNWIMDWTRVR